MDMPPCDVLAMDVGGFGDLFQIDDESGPQTRLEERRPLNCPEPHWRDCGSLCNFFGRVPSN
jgi:hypothetical protein